MKPVPSIRFIPQWVEGRASAGWHGSFRLAIRSLRILRRYTGGSGRVRYRRLPPGEPADIRPLSLNSPPFLCPPHGLCNRPCRRRGQDGIWGRRPVAQGAMGPDAAGEPTKAREEIRILPNKGPWSGVTRRRHSEYRSTTNL